MTYLRLQNIGETLNISNLPQGRVKLLCANKQVFQENYKYSYNGARKPPTAVSIPGIWQRRRRRCPFSR